MNMPTHPEFTVHIPVRSVLGIAALYADSVGEVWFACKEVYFINISITSKP